MLPALRNHLRRRRVRRLFFISVLGAASIVLFCAKDYNPFTDLTNAKARVLSWDFAGKDSVAFYTTAILKVAVAARDEVDSFSVSARCNRFWNDTVIRRSARGEPLGGGPYFFSISFYDTGIQTVSVKTYRSNGEMAPQNLSVKVFSPLRQSDIFGYFGNKDSLSTPPIGDNNVFYHWVFGKARCDSSVVNKMVAIVPFFSPAHDTGRLWVSDLSGNHPTPSRSFLYNFLDTSKPVIECVNAGLRGDSLVTGDTLLAFKAYIADSAEADTVSCAINNTQFDYVNIHSHVYTKLFKNLPELTKGNAPLRVTVTAMDNAEFRNTAVKTYWVIYSPEGVRTSQAHIEFLIPSNDSTTTSRQNYPIGGTALNYQGDTMTLAVTVNGAGLPNTRVISGNGAGPWSWTIHLDSLVNKVVVTAYDKNNRILDSAIRFITYNTNAIDTISPMIYDISIDGRPANNLDTSADSVELRIVAFDDGSGLKELKINGLSITADSSGYIWQREIGPLIHSPSGEKITIKATDNVGLVDSATISIYKNTPPVISVDPGIPPQICADSGFSRALIMYDADNDPITIKKLHAPPGMGISQNGIITWKPTAADIGLDSLTLWLSDGFDTNHVSRIYQWTFTCVACYRPIIPVRFTTTEFDFPSVLQAGVDTMSVTLATDTIPPGSTLRYSVRFTDRNEFIALNDSSPRITWLPAETDTGIRRLMVTVENGSVGLDTLYPSIRVVHRNEYPCSLSWTSTGLQTSNGELDLTGAAKADTVYFTIHDRDDSLTEKYTVSITRNNVRTVQTSGNRTFFITLSPDPSRPRDTLNVTVSDRTGTSDSVTLYILYRAVGYSLQLRLNTTPAGAGVYSNQVDFPVLIRLTTMNFDFSKAKGKGEDAIFRKTDGAILPREIERWDSAAGLAEVWVKADTVYGNDNAHFIVMNCGGTGVVSNSDPHSVFDTAAGFRGVWHLADKTGIDSDATANRFNGAKYGNPLQVAGVIGPAHGFDGVNDYVDMGNVLNPGNSSFTVSAWIKRGAKTNINTIFCKTNGGNPGYGIGPNNYGWGLMMDQNGFLKTYMATSGNSWGDQGTFNISSSAQVTDMTAWHHIAAVVNRSNNQNVRLYIDGVDVSGNSQGTLSSVGFINNTQPARIAIEADGDYPFTGSLDEVTMSFAARSADWLRLCFMNQKPQDQLVQFP